MAIKYNERTGEFEEVSTQSNNYGYKKETNTSDKKKGISGPIKSLLITLLVCNLLFGLILGAYSDDGLLMGVLVSSFLGLYIWFFYVK